jgi:N4-gp56 family major capsid protein
MAKTEFGVNHPLAVKLWSKTLAREAYRKTFISKFIGKGEDSLIQEKTELKKSAGDKITCGLRPQLEGDGVEGDATLEGNEEALRFFDDSVVINQMRHATRSKGKMSEQRVPYNLRNEGKNGLSDWFARRKDTVFFNHICGNTAETRGLYTGHNTVTAPTTNRIIRAGNQANDESLTSSDIFTLDLIDIARERAETASIKANTGPLIRPIRIGGEDMYVMFIHDYQATSLRTNTATGQWADIQKAAMQGGDVAGNPIFKGSLGVYNGVILHKASRVTQGVRSDTGVNFANSRRAVLCGAQAATIAYGSENGAERYSWHEEMFDYGNQLGVSGGCIWGMKKTKFTPADDSATNAEDFGTIVVSTYATQTNPS